MVNSASWYDHNKDFEQMKGYNDFNMLSCYDHYLSDEEADTMLTYVHVASRIISMDSYTAVENKILSFFSELFDSKFVCLYNVKTKKLLKRNKIRYLNAVRLACKESSHFVQILPDEKIVIQSTFDLMFVVLFYEDRPEWLQTMTARHDLYLLPAAKDF